MKRGKKFLSIIAFLFLLSMLSSLAVANGLNLNSLGSRALAMGGAFVGLADDFSAIYWNPAGIAYFERKYFGFYGTDVIPSGTYKSTLVDAKTDGKQYFSWLAAYYIPLGENGVAGLGVYVPSGLGASWNGADFTPISMGSEYQWLSKIGLVTIAPALAFKVSDRVLIGGSLNINYGMFDVKMHAGSLANPIPPPSELDLGQYEESMSGWGYGATLGILVKPLEVLSVGAAFRTASTVKFKGDAQIYNLSLLGENSTSDLKRDVTWPMWMAAGVAFKPAEDLTLTGDLQWTQWSKVDVIKTKYTDAFWQAIMGQSGKDERAMYWNDSLQVRFGAEYMLKAVTLRGGYYFDPSPAPDRTMNVLLPSYDYNVLTLGFGYGLDSLQLDFGLEYLMGKDRAVPAERVAADPDWRSAMAGTYTMKIIVPNISISYKF
jgi:long-chain fatty acid transport protein